MIFYLQNIVILGFLLGLWITTISGHSFSTDYSKVIGSHFVTHSNLHILPLIYLLPLFPPLSCVGIVSNRFVELANEKIGVFKQ